MSYEKNIQKDIRLYFLKRKGKIFVSVGKNEEEITDIKQAEKYIKDLLNTGELNITLTKNTGDGSFPLLMKEGENYDKLLGYVKEEIITRKKKR